MRRSSWFWGIILVLIGVVLLLDNLGLLGGINVWNLIWPLFLIAVGVWMLWGTLFRRAPETEYADIPLDGANRANIRLNHGAGRLRVSGGAGPANLVEGEFGGGLDVDTRRNGDRLDVHMRVPVLFFPIFWSPGFTLDWNIALSRDVPLSLEMDTGAGESNLDLAELQVTELRLKSGASSTRLTLPARAGQTRVDISSGAASMDVYVPSGVAARIRVRGGLSSINVDAMRFPRTGSGYQSPDYDTAENRADIDIEMGVGSVTVR